LASIYGFRQNIETLRKENTQLREQIKLLQALTDAKMTILKGNKITSAEEQRGLLESIKEFQLIV